ncbi:tyrosine-type recombinase/integrase [Rhizobium pisi]|uniref:tyrosine-type recombinase/integrase n=1 Tax=Rhizobium pisi TaxID=574561 RepID=UPI0039B064AB
MARARILTKEKIDDLQYTKAGRRYDKYDGDVPNLVVRVGTRTKVFVLSCRFPGKAGSSRIKIGTFPKMSLEVARKKAREWNALIEQGIDPTQEDKRSEREERLKTRQTFRAALTDYMAWLPEREFTRHVWGDIAAIRMDFLAPVHDKILDKPVGEVKRSELARIIKLVRGRAPGKAMNDFGLLKTFFGWVTSPERGDDYAIVTDPLAGVTPGQLGLRTNTRLEVLDADEVRAYWEAAENTPYPWGPYFKVLLLTIARRSAVAGMRWSELDPLRRLWKAPPVRHKGKLIDHFVPLSDQLMEILAELHRGKPVGHGDCVFTTTDGQIPINNFSHEVHKFRLKAEAALREISPAKTMKHWVLHDMRRVDRTALSAMDVPGAVAEGMMAHGKKGIEGVYDQFGHLPQRRNAMAKLHDRLDQLVDGSKLDFWDDEAAGGAWEDFYRDEADVTNADRDGRQP